MKHNTKTQTDADIRRLIEPQHHEFSANYNYNQYGLRPWFACDRAIKDGDGSVTTEFDALGETWEATLYNQDSGLMPPKSGQTPAGTDIDHGSIREFRIAVTARDGVQAKKANFHIRPRWKGLKSETNDGRTVEIPVPDELANHQTDAVSVSINGANIPFADYNTLLRSAADAVGVSPHYFDNRHRTSNIQDAALYVRLHTDVSGPVHARTGPLSQIAHVLENDRDGYRKRVENDADYHGQQLPGFYNTATLGPSRVQEVMPNHELPIEAKHYYAREALSRDRDDPLRHPKVEVAYQVRRWDGTLRADADGLSQLTNELETWLYSILNEAGLDLRAGGNTYIEDAYFDAENGTTTANVVDLDLTEIRHEQESVIYNILADGMSPVQQETLQTLVADGGTVSPQDVADENNRHRDTVYDALRRMKDLIDHQYGQINLKSPYVAELVADALDQAEASLERATMASAKAVNAAERGLDTTTSAFIAWAEKHGVNYSENNNRMRIELGDVDGAEEVRRILREGKRLWDAMNRDSTTFREAQVKYRKQVGESYNYLTDDNRMKQIHTDAWRLL